MDQARLEATAVPEPEIVVVTHAVATDSVQEAAPDKPMLGRDERTALAISGILGAGIGATALAVPLLPVLAIGAAGLSAVLLARR